MHVREAGRRSAPVVLLLHGQVLDGSIWDGLARELAPRLRVLAPDLPGYGATPLTVPHSIAGVRAAIAGMLDTRGVRAAAIVGYSLGTHHALALALEGRIEVPRLALLGPLAGLEAPMRHAYRAFAAAVAAGARLGRPFAEMALPEAYAAAHPALVAEVAAQADAVSAATYVAELEALAELPDLRPALPRLRSRLLLRVGEEDRNTPPAFASEIAARVPGAELEIAPGIGHLYLRQDAEATIASVARFLGR